MFNDINIGPITIHMYGLMIAIGFMSALYLCIRRGKKKNLDENVIYGILYCAILGALVGCRLLYYIVEFQNILKDPSILWNFREGYVVYGGILGGILFSYIYVARIKKASFLDYFDLVMPAVALAQGFGRIGCLCAGCCYGAETDSWFHIVFHNSDYAPNNVPLIPTQLISSVGDFIFAAILLWYERKNPPKGRVAAAYLCMYGIGRFLIEFLRNDYRGSIGFLSTSQIISIGAVIAGALMFALAPKFASNREAQNP
ncbi:MAG: prolipoprotein diacylglyceryl transferase [Lachnospiraceae bacterium]